MKAVKKIPLRAVSQAMDHIERGLAIARHPHAEKDVELGKLLWKLEGEIGLLELLELAPEAAEQFLWELTLCRKRLEKDSLSKEPFRSV